MNKRAVKEGRKGWAFVLILGIVANCADGGTSVEQKERQKQREEEYSKKNQEEQKRMYEELLPVTIYGKVVDRDGNTVPDADVCISWQRATLLLGNVDFGSKDWVKTDKHGFFNFTCVKPCRAFASAKKEGYEGAPGGYTEDLIWHKTSETSPAVITLRKMGATTFLIVHPSGNISSAELLWMVSNRSARVSWDLLAKVGETKTPIDKKYADLQVDVSFDTTGRCWTVVYRATNGTDGIVCSDKFLYIAPEEGYQKEIAVQSPSRAPMYLYLRTRSPAIYSRLFLEHEVFNDLDKGECIRIRYKVWINPYGERNLEYDTAVQPCWRVRDALTEEAKAAIQAKRLPPKPDLPKRIKESNEKVAREKAEREKAAKERGE